MYVNYACHTWMAWPRFALWYCGWSSHWKHCCPTSSRLSSWFIDSRLVLTAQLSRLVNAAGLFVQQPSPGKESAGAGEFEGPAAVGPAEGSYSSSNEQLCHSNKVELEFTPSRAYNWSFQSFARVFFFACFFFHNKYSTRWAPTDYKWIYNPCKWLYKWITGVISPYLWGPHVPPLITPHPVYR